MGAAESETTVDAIPLLTRESQFSYTCRQCNRCCWDKHISVNPYEVIRLAEVLQLSTGEVLERFTEGGVALKVRDEPMQPCIFLGEKGCTVHAGRPLACRLYPLGRIVDTQDGEHFCLVEPHPQTEGIYGESGTVAEYLETQSIAPFLKAAEAYYALLQRIEGKLQTLELAPEIAHDSLPEDSEFLDADAVLRASGQPLPTTPEEKYQRHITLLDERIATL